MVEDPTKTRQRIDYQTLPNGDVKAILTISLPGGITKRFESVTSAAETKEVSGALLREVGCCAGSEVGISIFKRIGRIAKSVASSKVFELAAKGLAIAGPLLGPIAPFALGAAATLGVAGKLAKAGVAAAHGATDLAASIAAEARRDASKLTSTPEGAERLLAVANSKRLGAEAIADGSKPAKASPAKASPASSPPSSSSKPQTASDVRCAQMRGTTTDVLAAARAGRVRSNQAGPINAAQLLQAHNEGRVFWVS
jgi:hypothetical protein